MFVVASTWKLLFCSQNFLCGGKAIQNTQDFYVKINSFCISFRDNNVSICNLFSCHVDNRTAATCSRCHYTGTRPGKWENRSRRIWPIILLLQVCSRNFILQSFHLTGILWTLLLQGLFYWIWRPQNFHREVLFKYWIKEFWVNIFIMLFKD